MNVLATAPKRTRVNRKCSSCPFTLNRKRNASLSSCFIPTCRNTFSMSPSNISVDILAFISISQMSGWKGGPLFMQSSILFASSEVSRLHQTPLWLFCRTIWHLFHLRSLQSSHTLLSTSCSAPTSSQLSVVVCLRELLSWNPGNVCVHVQFQALSPFFYS